jgi:hypothetical protein
MLHKSNIIHVANTKARNANCSEGACRLTKKGKEPIQETDNQTKDQAKPCQLYLKNKQASKSRNIQQTNAQASLYNKKKQHGKHTKNRRKHANNQTLAQRSEQTGEEVDTHTHTHTQVINRRAHQQKQNIVCCCVSLLHRLIWFALCFMVRVFLLVLSVGWVV